MIRKDGRHRTYFELDYNFCPQCKGNMEFAPINEKEVLTCSDCDFVFWNNPRPVVSALVAVDNQVLLIKRAKGSYQYYWALPGGVIDIGEEPREAAARELYEETLLTASAHNILDAYAIYYAPAGCTKKPSYVTIDIVFEMLLSKTDATSSLPTSTDEALEIALFKPHMLPDQIAFGHKEIINSFFSQL